ncbi:hypothetical protein AAFF_G00193190 [Aldrovandia affinis]|uniref:Uncharacterized protein n=1 Tax=Aldrovandia affinis TaxID=143900 RepID=A0AAD7RJ44_9TELE|nr:hypothetical protein AAFF_G00193190 [Aldrovandia affinis]
MTPGVPLPLNTHGRHKASGGHLPERRGREPELGGGPPPRPEKNRELEHTAPDNDGLLPRSSLTTERVLYGPREGCRTPELQRQWRIINTVKQVLWEARNIRVFQELTVDLFTLRRRIQNFLQDSVLVDFLKDERGARRKWGVSHWK